jgi:hypothetical protein
VIREYVERIARELDFDPSLARCVCREVEDHLWQTVAANPAADRQKAELRAVADFGDSHAIAAQFAVVSLARRSRRVGGAALALIAAVFVAMESRLTWYSLMQWPTASGMAGFGRIVASIDRLAFWLSVLAGFASWVYIESRPIPAAVTAGYRSQLRRFILVSSAAAGALIASVASDGLLTSARLAGIEWSPRFLVPLLSMAIEITCAGLLVLHIRGMRRRTVSAVSSLK